MPNGAFALYVDQQAGAGGGNQPIDRIVPLPRLGNGQLEFDDRRLTLSYDNIPPGALGSLRVTGRFLGVAGAVIDITIPAGRCRALEVPREACAAALHVDPAPAGSVRGPLSALVEYKDS